MADGGGTGSISIAPGRDDRPLSLDWLSLVGAGAPALWLSAAASGR